MRRQPERSARPNPRILHYTLEEFRGASKRRRLVRDVMRRKDKPATGLAVMVNDIFDGCRFPRLFSRK